MHGAPSGAEASTPVPPTWWTGALSLAERVPNRPVTDKAGPTDDATARLTRWRAAPGGAIGVDARLNSADLDTAGLLDLLDESAGSVAARVARPVWVALLDEALGALDRAPVAAVAVTGPIGDATALLPAMSPFLAVVGDRIDQETERHADLVDPAAIRAGVLAHLGRRLTALAARTLVVELAAMREAGGLSGVDGKSRFADFVRRVAGPDLATTLARYPVLARLLAQAGLGTADAVAELLDRFAADRTAIVMTLLAGRDPGRLVGLELGAGDGHQGGRSVAVLRFDSGAAVVYKPRSLALQAHFADLVAWLNDVVDGLRLRAVATLPMNGYGWLAYVEHSPCTELSDVDTFYHRQGALLALLYAMDGTDFHHENLIACGDQPVLVDVETLFHPTLPAVSVTGPDPAMGALSTSVARTALLPMMLLGEHGALDISGFGGGQAGLLPNAAVRWQDPGTDRMRLVRRPVEFDGAGANRPVLPGHDIDPVAHEAALLSGFRAGYDAIAAHRADLLGANGLLARCADDEIRIIVRQTATYASLLSESTHPDLLRDGLDRERLFDSLWSDAVDELRWRLVPHELADLWAGDVPMFTTRAGSTDVWTSGGQRLPGLLPSSGLTSVRAKLAGLGDVDRADQEWLITATMASREHTVHHRGGGQVPELRAIPPDPRRLLTPACELADELVARAVHDGDRANWLGLELVDGKHWTVLPMGAGLGEGYCGVALFLAQLGALTGLNRYTELARRAVAPLPRLLDLLTAEPVLAAEVGSGGFAGIGGLCYALARLSTLLADGDMVRWLAAAVPLVVTADDGRGGGLATGRAGGLAALLAVHAETGLPAALRSAVVLADRLADVWERPDVSADGGMLTGAAGDGWALLRAAAVTGSARHAAAGRAALRYDRDLAERSDRAGPIDLSWCTGLSGAVLARTAESANVNGRNGHGGTESSGGTDNRGVDDDGVDHGTGKWLDEAVEVLGEHRPLRDTSLCHGELGIAEALVTLGELGDERAVALRDHGAALLLGALEQLGPRCGTPRGVPSPGLLTGLAGIGYGLLRLGFADQVPSVLLLNPGMRPY